MRRAAVAAAVLTAGADAFSAGAFLPTNTRSVSSSVAPLRMTHESAAVSRRNALVTAAGVALTLHTPEKANAAGTTTATFKINTFEGVKGDVVFELYPDKAPKTVEAFKKYAQMGLYDDSAFFRVATFLKKGVLLAGDPYTKEAKYCMKDREGKDMCSDGNSYGPDGFLATGLRFSKDDSTGARAKFGKGGPDGWRRDSISLVKLEPEFKTGITHEKGVITMRRFDNPDSAGSQFMICMADMSKEFDGNYAAFGKVISGIELLDKILKVDTGKSESALRFPRDDKKSEAIWPAFDLPNTRQGIDKIIVD